MVVQDTAGNVSLLFIIVIGIILIETEETLAHQTLSFT